jgi:hypothetical protein
METELLYEQTKIFLVLHKIEAAFAIASIINIIISIMMPRSELGVSIFINANNTNFEHVSDIKNN